MTQQGEVPLACEIAIPSAQNGSSHPGRADSHGVALERGSATGLVGECEYPVDFGFGWVRSASVRDMPHGRVDLARPNRHLGAHP